MVVWRPWCLLCPADTEWTAINYSTYLCQCTSQLEYNSVHFSLHRRQQFLINSRELPILFPLHSHLKKKKSFSRRKENCRVCISLWAHDGPLQSYQHTDINKLFYYNTHENQRTLKFIFIYTIPLFSFQSAPFEIWNKYLNSSQSRRKNYSGSSQEELQFHAFVIKFIFCFVQLFPLTISCSFWTSNYPLDTPTWTPIKHCWIPTVHILFLHIALLYK